jgi:hypothetical protein
VAEAGHGADLVSNRLSELALVREGVGQELDRDVATLCLVMASPHFSHPADPDGRGEHETPEGDFAVHTSSSPGRPMPINPYGSATTLTPLVRPRIIRGAG